MAGCTFLAIVLPQNIWQLIQIKTELLAQTAPALILGIHWKGLRGGPVLAGFLVGTGFTLFFLIGNFVSPNQIPHRLWNIHAGLWGLALNGITIVLMSGARRNRLPFLT
jgi:SSS family solute:Na+ symporter